MKLCLKELINCISNLTRINQNKSLQRPVREEWQLGFYGARILASIDLNPTIICTGNTEQKNYYCNTRWLRDADVPASSSVPPWTGGACWWRLREPGTLTST